MKHIYCILVSIVCCCICSVSWAAESSPKLEMRAVWFTTHYGIDWPSTYSDGSTKKINQQKTEMTTILDKLVEGNLNTFCIQVRPLADAFYKSEFVPWANMLTGTRGKDPGWDPLAYACEEGHKRGLEVHIWINPYRYENTATHYTNDNIRRDHPEWLLTYNNTGSFVGTILDPGLPEVRKFLQSVIGEIINNYDIDGFIADDYFYPYGGTTNQDSVSMRKYKPADMDVKEWRRENVNQTVKMIYDTIQAVAPWIRMGMGPGGIWSTSKAVCAEYGLPYPDNLSGGESETYNSLGANTVAWIRDGYVEYVAPQIYWATTSTYHDFTNLCKWWAYVVKHYSDMRTDGKKCWSWPSVAAYRDTYDVAEIEREIDNTREFDEMGAAGAVYYNTSSYLANMAEGVKASRYQHKAILPPLSWKEHDSLPAPTNLQINGNILNWKNVNNETRYTVYAYPKGMNKQFAINQSTYLLGVTYTNSYDISEVSNFDGKTLAVCAYDRFANEFAPGTYNEGEEAPLFEINVVANDPKYGTTTGGGVYMEGTTITISAQAKYGYEFVMWNDSVTDNPRELDVFDTATYVAIFDLKPSGPVEAGTTSLTNLWKIQKKLHSGFLGTANENRSITYLNGQLYVADGVNSRYHVVDAEDGAYVRTDTLSEQYLHWHNLRALPNGMLLGGNTAGATSKLAINLVNPSNLKETNTTIALNDYGRSDYFYPYETEEGTYIVSLSNTGHAAHYIYLDEKGLPLKSTSTLVSNSELPIGTSAKAIPADAETFYASAYGTLPSRHLLATGEKIESFGGAYAKAAASGLCHFFVGGHHYFVLPSDNTGSFNIYEITSGLGDATLVVSETEALGENNNAAYTVDFALKQEEYDTYLYILAPNNGIAAYKFTFTPTKTDPQPPSGFVDTLSDPCRTTCQIFTVAGQYIGTFKMDENWPLEKGIYIVKTPYSTTKICK